MQKNCVEDESKTIGAHMPYRQRHQRGCRSCGYHCFFYNIYFLPPPKECWDMAGACVQPNGKMYECQQYYIETQIDGIIF